MHDQRNQSHFSSLPQMRENSGTAPSNITQSLYSSVPTIIVKHPTLRCCTGFSLHLQKYH